MSVTIGGRNVRCDKYDDKTGNQKHKKLFQKSSKDGKGLIKKWKK